MEFTAQVRADSQGELAGLYQAEVDEQGLRLRRGAGRVLFVPRGGARARAEGAELTLVIEARELRMTVDRLACYPGRVAAGAAAILRGDGAAPTEAACRIEPVLLALAALPLGIPLISLGGALPGGLGAGLAMLNLRLAQREARPLRPRLAWMSGVAALGYAVLILYLYLGLRR